MATAKNPAASRAARNAAKAKKRVRKYEKQYTYNTFESSIFEGEFKLPSMRQIPQTYALDLRTGDFNALYRWLEEVGVPTEDIDAIKSLDSEEIETFFEEWNSGELGK